MAHRGSDFCSWRVGAKATPASACVYDLEDAPQQRRAASPPGVSLTTLLINAEAAPQQPRPVADAGAGGVDPRCTRTRSKFSHDAELVLSVGSASRRLLYGGAIRATSTLPEVLGGARRDHGVATSRDAAAPNGTSGRDRGAPPRQGRAAGRRAPGPGAGRGRDRELHMYEKLQARWSSCGSRQRRWPASWPGVAARRRRTGQDHRRRHARDSRFRKMPSPVLLIGTAGRSPCPFFRLAGVLHALRNEFSAILGGHRSISTRTAGGTLTSRLTQDGNWMTSR